MTPRPMVADPGEVWWSRHRKGSRWACPACQQAYYSREGLRRHMAQFHRPCRFCPRAYIRVDQHEKRSHTIAYAIAAGACRGGES